MHVSESGYYRNLHTLGLPTKDELLSGMMERIRTQSEHNDNYGVERMQLALSQQGVKAGKRKITRIMREKGWLHRRRRPKGLTKVDPGAMFSENLLHQDFSAEHPLNAYSPIRVSPSSAVTDVMALQCSNA